jgi:Big-like domain-containing protein
VRRWTWLVPLLAAAACSNLQEGQGGVVALEIQFPELRTLEIGEQLQLSAQALNADGNPVDAEIAWRASNAALTVDGTGLVTGVAVGSSEVQAVVGSLASERVGFTIVLRADTLIIVGDSVLVVPVDADPPVTAALPVRLESLSPAGPLGSRPVIYQIVQPVAGTAAVVQLTGGVQSDTLTTAIDGVATTGLVRVTGQVPPDTAIVQVRANRTRGAPVPGSGQRFIVLFQ